MKSTRKMPTEHGQTCMMSQESKPQWWIYTRSQLKSLNRILQLSPPHKNQASTLILERASRESKASRTFMTKLKSRLTSVRETWCRTNRWMIYARHTHAHQWVIQLRKLKCKRKFSAYLIWWTFKRRNKYQIITTSYVWYQFNNIIRGHTTKYFFNER